MQTAMQQEQTKDRLSDPLDIFLSESKKAGFIAVTNLKKQWFYNSNEKDKLKADTAGRHDLYASINAFGYNSNRVLTRQSKQLKQIRNVAIDIDQYNLGLEIDETLDIIQSLIVSNMIPEPNLILTSRGIQLFYTIDKGAAPEMAWLAGYITEQLVSKLEHVGADYNATDVSRVMRVPNTINSRNGATVKAAIWNDEAYSLQELQQYCKPLTKKEYKTGAKATVVELPTANVAQFHRTNWARQRDLKRLLELRNGDMTGCRNTFVYILAFQQTLIFQDDSYNSVIKSVKEATKSMYTTDKGAEDSENWLENTVKSAYDGALGFLNHLKVNNYKIVYKRNDGIVKTMNTKKIINKLNISEAEQYEMGSLRNAEVKRRQDKDRKTADRRSKGMKSMADYNDKRRADKLARMQRIADLQAEGMKQKDIAEALNISLITVKRLIKELKENAK